MKKDALIIVRGAGDLATGTIHRLWAAGFRVLALEAEHPAAIRRQVALSEVVYEGRVTVEGMTGVLVGNSEQMQQAWDAGEVPVLVDPQGKSIRQLKPQIVVDAIIAKKNLGTNRKMAELTVALGPGFTACPVSIRVSYFISVSEMFSSGRSSSLPFVNCHDLSSISAPENTR